VEIRGGLHVGEVESAKGQTRGIAVHIGARITAHAGAGELLVSATVRDLVAGAGLEFEDFGEHELKGVPGHWRLFRVIAIDGAPLDVPLAAEEAVSRRARVEAPAVIRRRGTLLAVACVAFAVIIAGILFATNAERPLSEIPAASVGRIDPGEAEITDAFELDSDPTGIAANGDSLWVISLNAQTLTLLDPVTGEVGRTVSTQGGPTDVEVGSDGTVWVLNQFPDGRVIRFDPSATQVEYSESVGAGTNDMAVSEDAVWLTNEIDQTLLRLDVETNEIKTVLNRDAFDAAPKSVDVGGGFVWVAAGKEVVRMDPAGLDVDGTTFLRFESHDIHYGEGAVWLSHTADDFVSRIDPVSLTAVSIETPNGPVALASGYGFVWVAHPTDRTLLRIDPSSKQTHAIRVGSVPHAIASGGGAVWVAAGTP
jgi:streptogramin lyase